MKLAKRLQIEPEKLKDEVLKRQIRAIYVYSTPFLWEAHIQIIADALISEDGFLGTKRSLESP